MALRDDVAKPYQRNQIFLSASRRQAFQFKNIIQKAAAEVDVELKGGDKIILSNGAELHFLALLLRRHSPIRAIFILNEFFWVSRFAELRKVAGAMATLSGLRRTYFSTPSTERTRHTPTGTATAGMSKKATHKRQRFSVDWKTLHNGLICPDRTWRQIVTLEDVVNHGWKHTDIDEIRDENTEDEFRNLDMCEFVREGKSAFNRNILIGCGVDGYDDWKKTGNLLLPARWGIVRYGSGMTQNGSSGNGDSGAVSWWFLRLCLVCRF